MQTVAEEHVLQPALQGVHTFDALFNVVARQTVPHLFPIFPLYFEGIATNYLIYLIL